MLVTDLVVREKNENIKINGPQDFFPLLQEFYKDKMDKEYVSIVCLNSDHKVISVDLISIGTINKALFEPREVYRKTLLNNAYSFVLVHNHPSGNTSPSDDDLVATKGIKDGSKLIGVEFIDSIIVGEYNYFSFVENDILKSL